MIQRLSARFAICTALLALPMILGAGVNTWTGTVSVAGVAGIPGLVAASPADPDVVYVALGGTVYRSRDGGRTWNALRAFGHILALHVHPASPSSIYVAAYDPSLSYNPYALHISQDGGETWTRTLEHEFVSCIAGSPTDASTLFASTATKIFKTTNGGVTWSSASITGAISSLVIHPREPGIAYAGAEGFEYFGLHPGALIKTTDGGSSWRDTAPEAFESTTALAINPVTGGTVYAAVGPVLWSGSTTPSDVLRSEDGGASWVSAGDGLPHVSIGSLVVDPLVSGTLYAGTGSGIYRSLAGGVWHRFGRQLDGVPITSLAIDATGHRLHAGTLNGAYDLEMAVGPLDVAAGPAGASRVLAWDGQRRTVGTLDASGSWTAVAADASPAWSAVAIGEAKGAGPRVVWQSDDGRAALEVLDAGGSGSTTILERRQGWIVSDLSVGAGGRTHLLWTAVDGRMRIGSADASGAAADGPVYGPALGWSAVAIADAPGGDAWALWRSADGRAALSLHRNGTMIFSFKFAADANWSFEDVVVGADGYLRVLRTSPGGVSSVATVDSSGRLIAVQSFQLAGSRPGRIAAGEDGRTRLLVRKDGGDGELLLLEPDNTESSRHPLELD